MSMVSGLLFPGLTSPPPAAKLPELPPRAQEFAINYIANLSKAMNKVKCLNFLRFTFHDIGMELK